MPIGWQAMISPPLMTRQQKCIPPFEVSEDVG